MMPRSRHWLTFALGAALLAAAPHVLAADGDAGSNVQFDASKAKPRAVEALTSQRILHDYDLAWKNLAEAFNDSIPELVGAYFVGPANDALVSAINDQQKTGVHTHYLNQNHKLVAVFYSPEGDVMELHDTVVCDLQLLDGANVIHDEHTTLYYVVLMTPAADRWVVRQLQAVPSF
jgi:hypothetical protein